MSWVCDSELIRTQGSKVIFAESVCGSYFEPLNALYKPETGGIESGKKYFEFQCKLQTEGAFVGVTTLEHFAPGHQLRGLLYGGNLTDGNCLLSSSSFGKRITGEDKVGILLELNASMLKMYVYHNDQPLGVAFNISSPYPKPLYPVVHMYGSGEITVKKCDSLPKALDRRPSQEKCLFVPGAVTSNPFNN